MDRFFLFFLFAIAMGCKPEIKDDPIDQVVQEVDINIIDEGIDANEPLDSLTFALNQSISDEPLTEQMIVDTISYLALGDSYTIGQSVPVEERWPNQLRDSIEANNPFIHFSSVDILAQTGWTTSNLSVAMDNAGVDDLSFDLVSVLIGVNNQYQNLS
ncbi:MAG: hypothetical protein AAF193_03340, partial [Bacteroidota bacterium]